MAGPLAPFAGAFELELRDRGYTPLSTVHHLRQAARLSRWLDARGVKAPDLNTERVEEFLALQRREDRNRSQWSRPGLVCMLDVLSQLGILAEEEPARFTSPTETLLASFEHYLLSERGLTSGTVRGYVSHARRFMDRFSSIGELAGVMARDVTEAVLSGASGVSVSTAQNFVFGLRSFLRFCFVEGLMEADLSQAALPVTGRRRSSLPQGIGKADARALLECCDRRSALGRRDYALLVILLRLGLRAGEVAALRLDDIDWRAAELVVRGKGPRQDRLPLPVDVGEAIAAYLTRGDREATGASSSCGPEHPLTRSRTARSPPAFAGRVGERGSRRWARTGSATRRPARWLQPRSRWCRSPRCCATTASSQRRSMPG